MPFRFLQTSVSLLLLIVCCATNAQAQPSADGAYGKGTKHVKLTPVRLRLEMKIQVEGRDAKAAMKAWAEHKKKVREGLVEMKADLDSIRFDAARISETIAGMDSSEDFNGMSHRAFVTNVFDADMEGNQDAEEDSESDSDGPPKVYKAKSFVVAEWALPEAEDLDELVVLPTTLKAQIAKRSFDGKKIKAELTEEEQFQVTDYQRKMAQRGYYHSSQSNAPDIQIRFVGKLTADQEKAAIKDAYEQAAAQAKAIAEASGHKIGKLKSIYRSDDDAPDYVPFDQDSYGNISATIRTAHDPMESVAKLPTELIKRVVITTTFELE